MIPVEEERTLAPKSSSVIIPPIFCISFTSILPVSPPPYISSAPLSAILSKVMASRGLKQTLPLDIFLIFTDTLMLDDIHSNFLPRSPMQIVRNRYTHVYKLSKLFALKIAFDCSFDTFMSVPLQSCESLDNGTNLSNLFNLDEFSVSSFISVYTQLQNSTVGGT
uniref:Uncharacterized protein n=1 Tax=Glossina pallidipes TaxID=7398 RepID=A0A1B0AJ49_GLOPL